MCFNKQLIQSKEEKVKKKNNKIKQKTSKMNTVKRSGKKVSLIINCYTVPGSKLFTKSSTQY